jgi:hypothetical protein
VQYLINRDGRQFGPYPLEDLRRYLIQGSVLLTDLAWTQGMPTWVPVSQILGIPAPSAAPPPPVGPPRPPAPAAPFSTPTQPPAYLAPPPRKAKRGPFLIVLLIICFAAAAYFWRSGAFTRTVESQIAVDKTEILEFYDLVKGKPSRPVTSVYLNPWSNSRIMGAATPNPSDNRMLMTTIAYAGGSNYELRGYPTAGASANPVVLGRWSVTVPAAYSHPLDLTRFWEIQSPAPKATQLQFVGYFDGLGPSGGFLSRLLPDKPGQAKIIDSRSFLQRGYEDQIGATRQESLTLAGKPSRILHATNPDNASQTASFEFYDGLQVLRLRTGSDEKVFEVSFTSPRWKLWKDLGVGATTANIIAILGAPSAQGPEYLHYQSPELGGSLQYRIFNGICTGVLWKRHP